MNRHPKTEHLILYKWQPGHSGNIAGRPKSYMTILKELGYTKPVIATMVAEIMFMPTPKVLEISESRTEPAIRVMIARAFYRAAQSGDYKYIFDFMTILFSKPLPYMPETENKTLEQGKPDGLK